jgi:hypothetical protein
MPVCHEDVSPDERSAMLKLGAFTGSWFNTNASDPQDLPVHNASVLKPLARIAGSIM